jgi:hypothetical protein
MTETAPHPDRLDTLPSPASVPEGTMTTLVSSILDDAQKLVRQQFEMLKLEVKDDFQRSKRAAQFGGLGIVLLTVGLLGLISALAYFLHEHYQYSMWASWSITGGLFTAAGVALGVTSYILLERFNPLPTKTFTALGENLTWKTK